MQDLIEWFIPDERLKSRTDRELARIFVFTHLFGPILAQPMWLYLYFASDGMTVPLAILIMATWTFTLLPFMLRRTGEIRFVALLSFQILAIISLFAAYNYGGFNSPFTPWLIVSLLLGLFYRSADYKIILSLFAFDVLIFVFLVSFTEPSSIAPMGSLQVLGWLSTASATIYISWMALYYSRIVGMKSELEAEAEKSRETSLNLEEARTKAEELGRQRSRFFAKMSHELRTPLNGIIGYSEILLEELEDRGMKEDPRREDVERIKAAGKHLLSLVSRVLDIKSIENGSEDIQIDRESLYSICDDVSSTAIPNIKKNGSQFVVTRPDVDYILQTDATKLRQILINLLSNAAKFTKNGTVDLEVSILTQDGNDILRASIRDTGIGISSEGLTRIFGSYEQAEVNTVADFGGTGIGLTISQHFARLLGGEITVKSTFGRGSCFTLWMPVHRYIPSAVTTGTEKLSGETSFQRLAT